MFDIFHGIDVFSSPEHEVLKVSYCPSSVVGKGEIQRISYIFGVRNIIYASEISYMRQKKSHAYPIKKIFNI